MGFKIKSLLFFIFTLFLTSEIYAQENNDCAFNIAELCFRPALGIMAANKPNDDNEYQDIRFATILHEKINDSNKLSFNFMIAPGEGFIDAAGAGISWGAIKADNSSYAVLNFGVMAKNYPNDSEIGGGIYILVSASTW